MPSVVDKIKSFIKQPISFSPKYFLFAAQYTQKSGER